MVTEKFRVCFGRIIKFRNWKNMLIVGNNLHCLSGMGSIVRVKEIWIKR